MTAEAIIIITPVLAALPGPISRQLRTISVADDLNATMLSMAVNEHTAVSTQTTEFNELRTQTQQLTEQVAALTTKSKSESSQYCYYCNQPGNTLSQCYCPVRIACFTNNQGVFVWGNRCPPFT